jgi:hypothetical protein
VRWESAHGFIPILPDTAQARAWGSLILGGAAVTGGGLVFAAGTFDAHLYAYDVETGSEVWREALPAGGNATPMTYMTPTGRQFVVIAAGGHGRMGTPMGDWVVAFALPEDAPPPAPRDTPIDGSYEGRVAIEGNPFPVRIVLSESDGRVSGRVDGIGHDLNGTIEGTRAGSHVSLVSVFRFPSEACEGRLAIEADLSRDGRRLAGDVRATGACSDDEEEKGTITVRRTG